MKYKYARTTTELQEESKDYTDLYDNRTYLNIKEWSVEDIEADIKWLGLSGSPTKVKKIENVVFQTKENITISADDKDINLMMKSLIDTHIIG